MLPSEAGNKCVHLYIRKYNLVLDSVCCGLLEDITFLKSWSSTVKAVLLNQKTANIQKTLCIKAKVSETDFGVVPVLLNKLQFLCTYNIYETLCSLSCCRPYSTPKGTVRGRRCCVLSRLGACSVLLIFPSSQQNLKPLPRMYTSHIVPVQGQAPLPHLPH